MKATDSQATVSLSLVVAFVDSLPLAFDRAQVSRSRKGKWRQRVALDVVNVAHWVVGKFVLMAGGWHSFNERVRVVATIIEVLFDSSCSLLDDIAQLFVALQDLLALHGLFCRKTADFLADFLYIQRLQPS